ncbi:MAG: hypothetical protein ACI8Z9_000920 [Paraglaciecola sp.]|jgi:hypothetical protein
MPTLFNCKQTRQGRNSQPNVAGLTMLTLLTVLCSPYLTAEEQDDWWFDVEVIVFERNIALQDIAETFPMREPSTVSPPYVDLLTPYIKPDVDFLRASMPFCRQADQQQRDSQQLKIFQSLKIVAYEKADTQDAATSNVGSLIDPPVETRFEATAERAVEPSAGSFADPTVEGIPDPDIDNEDIRPIERLLSIYDKTLALSPPMSEIPFIDWQLPSELLCTYQQPDALLRNPFEPPAPEPERFVPSVPLQISGQERFNDRHPHLLPQSALLLSALFKDINRQRQLSPLLHLGWRQPVLFGRNKAAKFRLFAGNNYAKTYSASGEHLPVATTARPSGEEILDKYLADPLSPGELITSPAQDGLFTRISAALADPSPIAIANNGKDPALSPNMAKKVNELWQLDGEFKVYLQYVGRTPYLHIDSDLEYRLPLFVKNKPPVSGDSPVGLASENVSLATQDDKARGEGPNYLQSVKFNQLRRVISKQLHYFDHPLFGMVVQINRYKWPEPEIVTDTLNNTGAIEK